MKKIIYYVMLGVITVLSIQETPAQSLIWSQDCYGSVNTTPYDGFTRVDCSALPEPTPVPTQPPPTPTTMRIDHTSVDVWASIPRLADGRRIGADQRAYFVHASVGGGLDWALGCMTASGMWRTNPDCTQFAGLGFDRSNYLLPYWASGTLYGGKPSAFAALVPGLADSYDVMSWKFCYIDALSRAPNFDTTRLLVEGLEAQYPQVEFPWFTIPLVNVYYPGIETYNRQVREYTQQTGRALYDLADIESHTATGAACLDGQGREVLCDAWRPGFQAVEGHLNNAGHIRLAKAWWVMMARYAGWQP